MVAAIRTDVREASNEADTAWLEQALVAVGALPREDFVSAQGRGLAYMDLPQNIGFGQTISDPYIVAIMTGALQLPPGANVLDVGTGSGYQAAVLGKVARHVSSIEIVPELANSATICLKRLGFANVEVRSGDGFAGWPEHAPFDGIVVAAGGAEIPSPLIDQLKPGGRLVMPVGPTVGGKQLLVVTKNLDGSLTRCSLGPAVFIPLTGRSAVPPAGVRTRRPLDPTLLWRASHLSSFGSACMTESHCVMPRAKLSKRNVSFDVSVAPPTGT